MQSKENLVSKKKYFSKEKQKKQEHLLELSKELKEIKIHSNQFSKNQEKEILKKSVMEQQLRKLSQEISLLEIGKIKLKLSRE